MSQLDDVRLRSSKGARALFLLLVCGGITVGTWKLMQEAPAPNRVVIHVEGCSDSCRDALYGFQSRLLEEHGFAVVPSDEVGGLGAWNRPLAAARSVGALHAIVLRMNESRPREGAGGDSRVAALVNTMLDATTADGTVHRAWQPVAVEGDDLEHALTSAGVATIEAALDEVIALFAGSPVVTRWLATDAEPHQLETRQRLQRARAGLEDLRGSREDFARHCTRSLELATATEGLSLNCSMQAGPEPPRCPSETLVALLAEGVVAHSASRQPRFRLGHHADVERSPTTFDRLLYRGFHERAYYITHAAHIRPGAEALNARATAHVEIAHEPSGGELGEALVVTSTNGAPANGAPANGAPSNGAPANGAPANGAPANGAPANGAPSNGASSNGAPSSGAPSNGAPSNGAPSNGAPSNGAPSNGAPSNGASSNGASSNGASSNGAPPGSDRPNPSGPSSADPTPSDSAPSVASSSRLGQVVWREPPPVRLGLPHLSPTARILTFTRQAHESAPPELQWLDLWATRPVTAAVTPFGVVGQWVQRPTGNPEIPGRAYFIATIAGAASTEGGPDISSLGAEEQLFDDLLTPNAEERATLDLPLLTHLAVVVFEEAPGDLNAGAEPANEARLQPTLVARLGGVERPVQGVLGAIPQGLVVASATRSGCALGVFDWDRWTTNWLTTEACLHGGAAVAEPSGPAVYGIAQISDANDASPQDREVVRVSLTDGRMEQLTHDAIEDVAVLAQVTTSGTWLAIQRQPPLAYARFAPSYVCTGLRDESSRSEPPPE